MLHVCVQLGLLSEDRPHEKTSLRQPTADTKGLRLEKRLRIVCVVGYTYYRYLILLTPMLMAMLDPRSTTHEGTNGAVPSRTSAPYGRLDIDLASAQHIKSRTPQNGFGVGGVEIPDRSAFARSSYFSVTGLGPNTRRTDPSS